MTDAAAILTANGMANAAVIVRAAQLEGMNVAIAATLVAGESWGKHIWGHDGVQTGGAYVKGGPVTRDNYLTYRTLMRAGKIGRQGVGICQCTSAQYQDVADALGGCFDPLANCRSGFRGMGALMRAYGTRDGARRYNGTGARAEAYANSFMARLATWQTRLAGTTVTAAAVAAQPQEDQLPSVNDVWNQPIEDLYTPQAGDVMPAFSALGWAVAHAAYARTDAAAARASAQRCEQKLDQIIAKLGQG